MEVLVNVKVIIMLVEMHVLCYKELLNLLFFVSTVFLKNKKLLIYILVGFKFSLKIVRKFIFF